MENESKEENVRNKHDDQIFKRKRKRPLKYLNAFTIDE
jgi:hypothetical protein